MERVSEKVLNGLKVLCNDRLSGAGIPERSRVDLPARLVLEMVSELLEHRDLERANDALLAMSLHAMGDE